MHVRSCHRVGRTFVSPSGTYVEADVGIDQRFLGGGDAVDHQLGIQGRTTVDQPEGDRAELVVPSRATNESDRTPVEL